MFIGHTRFSLYSPSSRGWRASNGSQFASDDDYRAYLFSDERLQPRMHIFLNWSLPQLKLASVGFDISHIVSYPSILPEKYKAQLREALDAYPFLVLDEREVGTPAITPTDLARQKYAASRSVFGLFRLDDDDLLPVDYFAQMAAYLRPENAGMIVSLGSGVTALYSEGLYFNVKACHVPMIAIGLMNICMFTEDGRLQQPEPAPHHLSDRSNAVILDSRRIGYMWTRHLSQDSNLGRRTRNPDEAIDALIDSMERHATSDPVDSIGAAFPALASAFTQAERPAYLDADVLVRDLELTETPVRVAVSTPGGAVVLTADLEAPAGDGGNNVLLAFELIDRSGQRIMGDDDAGARLIDSGLLVSKDPEVGVFCYLPVAAGRSRVRKVLQLPSGLELRAISMRRYRTAALSVKIRSLVINRPAQA